MIQKEEQRPATPHRVRAAQVYFERLQCGAEGDVLRRRIDWMADQAQGQRVLGRGMQRMPMASYTALLRTTPSARILTRRASK